MKTLLAGAILFALSLPAPSHAHEPAIASAADCLPYAPALASLKDAGAQLLGEMPAPFTRSGTTLYLTMGRLVLSAGIAPGHGCIYLPASVIGHLAFDPAEL